MSLERAALAGKSLLAASKDQRAALRSLAESRHRGEAA